MSFSQDQLYGSLIVADTSIESQGVRIQILAWSSTGGQTWMSKILNFGLCVELHSTL